MNFPRLTLLASHERSLREYFAAAANRHERAAIVLFRRLSIPLAGLQDSDRYIGVSVHPFEEEWVKDSSPAHIAFETAPFREFYRRCEEESLVFGFAHSHPTGFPTFSSTDDSNELSLLKAISNRNGVGVSLVGLIWTGLTWKARVRNSLAPNESTPARHVLVPDRPFRLYRDEASSIDDDAFLRQSAVFGKPFVDTLQSLRIGVIGLGGTGSPTATLLARSGAGELVLIDPDQLEESNLNRVRGARRSDVGHNKAELQDAFIRSMGLPTHVTSLADSVDTARGVDAIASCDVVFGCTDDQIGREVLNTAVYAYALPYIDVGLGGQVATDASGRTYLKYHHGRVSTILPEAGECLFCQGVLTEQQIKREYALRERPHLTDAEARERYIEGGLDRAPGVGPFTSATADFGVATLYDFIAPFRKFPGELRWDAFSIDFVKMTFQSASRRDDLDCPYCGTRQFLTMSESLRLNRPILGRRDVAL
jgi:molybdopterin/thiamine biosynthesis adenylyltransferase